VDERELQRAMVALSQGDRAAFRPVFDALWPLLRRFTLRALGDAGLAEDAAQAALTKLFLRAAQFDPQRDAVAWALGFASFEVLSLRKRAARRERLDGLIPAPPAGETPEDLLIETNLRAAAAEALGRLRPVDLETLEMVLREQRPAQAAFRKRLQRAMTRLREAFWSKHGID
jgi:DNA-directed RNA polymerase specialized sigma24 family protein